MREDLDKYWDCLDQAMEASSGGRVDEALAWLDEALRAHPMGAEAHNGRGEILWDHGRTDEALAEFDSAAKADATYLPAQLNRIELLIEDFQEHERALELADVLLGSSLDGPSEAEIYYLKAKALFYLDDLGGALFLLRRAIKTHGDVGIYRGFEGQILFEQGDLEAASGALRRSLGLDPECSHSLYYMGLVREQLGDYETADHLFSRAAAAAPDLYPLPVRIDEVAFDAAVHEAIAELPERVREYVRNVPVIVEDVPDLELIAQEQLSPQILGLFVGVPATEPGHAPGLGTAARVDIDRVLLYKRNLEKVAGSHEELVEQIQITVQHELGHYLGLDEDELERMGLG
jgi:predicted Zn-dependent protease with MMP-like domain/Flp pilus assembly protein TadD